MGRPRSEPVFKLLTLLFKFFRRLLHGVVPVAVKFVLDERELLHLTVGHLDSFLVYAVVEFGPDGQPGSGSRGVPRSHEVEDLEGSVHEAGCPSGGLGDVASSDQVDGAHGEVARP